MVNLLSPITIGDLQLKNRIVLPPMQTGLADEKGRVTEKLVDHYGQYSSDVGLIIVEHSFVLPEGKYSAGQLGIDRDGLIPGLETLAEVAREGGASAIIQLNHAGLKAEGTELNILDFDYEGSLSKYSLKEIDRIVESFVKSGIRAMKAGFQGVEIHGAHGFLLNQFTSPITNDREDEYGGRFEDRIRLPLRIVEKVRQEIDEGIISYRLGATDLDSRGITIEESKTLAKKLDDLGLDLLDVSGGLCGSSPDELEGEQGFFVSRAREIEKAVSCHVVGVGGITDPVYGNELVTSGDVDLIAAGRAQLNDPTWAARAASELR
ncbi:MAG: NADH:flavin oxidoreductase [Candidatus Bipolaricaulota bacterium]|nr:NADH:flavin oxidoreductase [Candidatus Bipolaricaulota bacterium]MBS3791730.1 NADH:flavin oxidoreductase [Candidatus Bipolaricaulota bacterium]